MKNYFKVIVAFFILLFLILNFFNYKTPFFTDNSIIEPQEPSFQYGILVDSFNIKKEIVKEGETLGSILGVNNMYYALPDILAKSEEVFDFERGLAHNKEYTVIYTKDSVPKTKYFIYQADVVNYIVVDLTKGVDVYKGKKEVITKLALTEGKINSSLALTIDELNVSARISNELSEIYAWTIDFFKIQKGDAFKVYYENNYIDGQYIGIGKVLAAEFTHKNQNFYAFLYKDNENYGEYFDEKGRTLRKAFLKAPLDYYRISSRFSRNRKHPVTGQWKGHFGTDYAAPKGTPIMTTANGTIVKASYTRNNGYYVKVRHNGTYTTQYLHMSKIKKGIRKGVYVKQGEVIGYVGSTGLATGPHVCYRFWKNNKQVDPYKQKLPPGEPISNDNKQEFLIVKDSLMRIINRNI